MSRKMCKKVNHSVVIEKENFNLKTCPFCGGIAEIYKRPTGLSCKKEMKDIPSRITEYFKVESNHGSVYYSYYDFCFIVRCMDKRCVGRDTKAYYDEAEAVEAWNRRANENTYSKTE